MIPSILAWQLQKGMGDFVDTSFPMTNEPFKGSLRKMTETKGALFHDPYVSVRLPFRKAGGLPTNFASLQMDRVPYVHQQKAFDRLTGDDGRSTLIATGTGSGKTECFLYPILDYCYRHRNDKNKGIKAIIIYPMNALASDQARRIACIIHNNPELKDITCGMYVGGQSNDKKKTESIQMTETEVITDHETLLKDPPDILLTNYKMLDYLMVRPKDSKLWARNNSFTLKYIAVDELHTFDGAQGTDLACLIRRIKKRLDIGKGYLCCIGTSATMGSGDDAGNIRKYAEEIFGETFEDNSVITEDRLTSDEFFTEARSLYSDIPTDDDVIKLDGYVNENDVDKYLELAATSWFPGWEYGDIGSGETRIELGNRLMGHAVFRKIMEFTDGRFTQNLTIAKEFPELGEGNIADFRICSLYALISHARSGKPGSTMPFLNVQVQFWMKELRRIVGKVDARNVTYALCPDLTTEQRKHHLPVVSCRECGITGWATLKDIRESSIELPSIEEFYNKYFDPASSSQILMTFPAQAGDEDSDIDSKKYELCPNCLRYKYKTDKSTGRCSFCDSETMTVTIPELQKTSAGARGQFVCPYCGSRRGLTILGLRGTREISAALSQIFASKYNDDKKVLAFSDSVQDAAHRAGFFNSRTWKYSLHSSLQHYCDAGGGDGKSLNDFQNGYIEYLHKEYPSNADIVGYFTAPNMTWRHSYEDTVKSGTWEGSKQDETFMAELESRLRYEILLEYGLSGNYGKTLEKTGCSTLSFRRSDVSELVQEAREFAVNELGLTEEPLETFNNICIGILMQLKTNGAFADSVFDSFLSNNCNTYMLDENINRWLPTRQTGRNTPRFYAKQLPGDKKTDQLDNRSSFKYRNWIKDCVRNSPMLLDDVSCGDLCDFIMERAVDKGILEKVSVSSSRDVYGINTGSVYVSGNVRQMKCSKCGVSFAVSDEDAGFWAGAPCRRKVCTGTLSIDDGEGKDYFGRLYKNGDFYKINAKEHTGLLEKDVREKTEVDFKRHGERSAWDPNVLSCTPTLEMGIDVGDLSTVVLCSVPPAQSQFTQRSGRAGRTDGNALTIAVANAKSHDLYFYEDPLDMIEGRVEPPRIFLEASAVLERQLTAFCMDTWVKISGDEDLIPSKISQVLKAMEDGDKAFFPHNFIDYVKANKHTLFSQFSDMLGIGANHSCATELKAFIGETGNDELSPMGKNILDAFEVRSKQVKSLRSDMSALDERIKELKAKPKDKSFDADIRDAENEKKAFSESIGKMISTNVFNFLSDEGILPNYAFPEAGVFLRAVLYRKKSDDETADEKYDVVPYEYSRSAANAISEFAPGNTFYVDGKKLSVDQIDINTSPLEKWRLCPDCSYAELESPSTNKTECPRCHSKGWRDIGQVKEMLKVQTVYSNMSYRKTLIDDSSDDRFTTFYNKQILVDVDTAHDIEKAYRIQSDKYDFGYEFDKRATIRDINFGPLDSVGEKTKIAGNVNVKKGFTICRECGKVQTSRTEPSHSCKCKYYKKDTNHLSESPYVDCLFIYREFDTETLRLLVPFAAGESRLEGTQSFVAAFMLGMKEYFGNVDHLRVTVSNYPDIQEGVTKQYLTIYDSVPGGTGYLKQLLTEEDSLTKILEKALQKLENCSCKDDPEKDGCYHCIYPYSMNREIGSVSRKRAIEILEGILSAGKPETIGKLDDIPTNHIGDSVLEEYFLEAVKKEAGDGNFVCKEVNGKVGYAVKFGEYEWEIEPQVDLGPADGVSVVSRPDFVLWPKSESGALPVTIFTDGFAYHDDISHKDTLKREAIRRSGKFRVWSLSYEDVVGYLDKWMATWYTESLDYVEMPSSARYEKFVGNNVSVMPKVRTSLELLFDYLKVKDAENEFKKQAGAYAYSLLDATLNGNSCAFNDWCKSVNAVNSQTGFTSEKFELATCQFGEWSPQTGKKLMRVYAGVDSGKSLADRVVAVCAVFNDKIQNKEQDYKKDWNGFLKFCNVMQFSNSFIGVTEKGLETYTYAELGMESLS